MFPLRPKQYRPTEGELRFLRVSCGTAARSSVRDVQRVLDRLKPTGYTTVLKLMQIMTEKGLAARDENQRPQIYDSISRQQLLRNLLDRAFGGSVKALVMQALAAKKSSPEDLEAMEKLLDRFEGEAKNPP